MRLQRLQQCRLVLAVHRFLAMGAAEAGTVIRAAVGILEHMALLLAFRDAHTAHAFGMVQHRVGGRERLPAMRTKYFCCFLGCLFLCKSLRGFGADLRVRPNRLAQRGRVRIFAPAEALVVAGRTVLVAHVEVLVVIVVHHMPLIPHIIIDRIVPFFILLHNGRQIDLHHVDLTRHHLKEKSSALGVVALRLPKRADSKSRSCAELSYARARRRARQISSQNVYGIYLAVMSNIFL